MNTKNKSLHLFIVNNDPSIVVDLHDYIENRFNSTFEIFSFNTGKDALLELNRNTSLVILDNYLVGENGTDIRKLIRASFPHTRVIMYATNQEMTIEIDQYIKTLKPNMSSRPNRLKRITHPIRRFVNYPTKLLVAEFKVKEFVAIFIVAFLYVGIIAVSIAYFIS